MNKLNLYLQELWGCRMSWDTIERCANYLDGVNPRWVKRKQLDFDEDIKRELLSLSCPF